MTHLTSRRQAIVRIASLMIAACIGAPSLVGCAGLPKDVEEVKKKPKKPHGNPTQIVLTANPCWLQDNNNQPTQTGLFCRMYFFQGNDPIPLSIAGDLKVTAFDASKGGSPEKPQGVYHVANGELGKHFRPDVVGDSYVFWFHYQTTEVANLEVQATLKLKNGKEITSGSVKVQLDPEKITTEDAMAQLSSRKAGAKRSSVTYIDGDPKKSNNDGEATVTSNGESTNIKRSMPPQSRRPVSGAEPRDSGTEVKPVSHTQSSGEL